MKAKSFIVSLVDKSFRDCHSPVHNVRWLVLLEEENIIALPSNNFFFHTVACRLSLRALGTASASDFLQMVWIVTGSLDRWIRAVSKLTCCISALKNSARVQYASQSNVCRCWYVSSPASLAEIMYLSSLVPCAPESSSPTLIVSTGCVVDIDVWSKQVCSRFTLSRSGHWSRLHGFSLDLSRSFGKEGQLIKQWDLKFL